jgi:hypothetical protein
MQMQIEEMKKMIEELRKEIRSANGPKEGSMRDRKGFRQFGPNGFPGRQPDGDKEKLPPPREKDKE